MWAHHPPTFGAIDPETILVHSLRQRQACFFLRGELARGFLERLREGVQDFLRLNGGPMDCRRPGAPRCPHGADGIGGLQGFF